MHRPHLLSLIILLFSFNCFGQISFQKGYYIDKQGNRTDCFIKDVDWTNSPRSFDYRLTEPGETHKMNTEDVAEFAVGDSKYIHANVQYDQSSQELKKAGLTSGPDWLKADLLLRVIVEGKAKLYHYNVTNYSLFFFSVDGSPIEQLVFKIYLNPSDVTQLVTNRFYLSQLNGRIKCDDNAPVTDKQVSYHLKPLANHFRDFNRCSGDVAQETPKTKKSFSLRLTPGVDFTKVTGLPSFGSPYAFGSNTNFRFGVDLQFALPFNHGKWAIVSEPNYNYFNGYDKNKNTGLKYQLLEFPVGVRHLFFLSEKSYIFLNAMAFIDFPFGFSQTAPRGNSIAVSVSDRGSIGYSVGAGFAVGRLSLEGRYFPARDVTRETNVTYTYTKSTIILGVRVF